jgi:cytochrome c556
MKNEGRIVELLAEMVKGQDKLIEEVSQVKTEVSQMKTEVSQMKTEIFKHGIQTAENSRAIFKLADEIRLVAEHEKRIAKLEVTVFK